MGRSHKEALKHFKNDSKSTWDVVLMGANFVWLLFCTYQIYGSDKTVELIFTKIIIGFLPFVFFLIARYCYHYLRSDLYLEQSKPELGKSLITGQLLNMVEHWTSKPIASFGHSNVQYNAYKKLLQYRSSYDYENIHSKIDEFIKAFEVGGNLLFPEIKTSFSTKEEARKEFIKLKALAKEINQAL